MDIGGNYNHFFESDRAWGVSARGKKLGLEPLKLTLNWMEQLDKLTPRLEEVSETTKYSCRFGSALRLPEKAAKLGVRIHHMFRADSFGREFLGAAGKTLQLGGSIVGALKLADEFNWIRITPAQDAMLSPILTWGLVASIGFSIKSVCKSISRLAENKMNNPEISPVIYQHEMRKFTIDLLKLMASISKVALQVFAFVALVYLPAAPLTVLILSTVSLVAHIGAEFYQKIHPSPLLPVIAT